MFVLRKDINYIVYIFIISKCKIHILHNIQKLHRNYCKNYLLMDISTCLNFFPTKFSSSALKDNLLDTSPSGSIALTCKRMFSKLSDTVILTKNFVRTSLKNWQVRDLEDVVLFTESIHCVHDLHIYALVFLLVEVSYHLD